MSRGALQIISELSGVRDRVRMLPAAPARSAAAIAGLVARARGHVSSICPARIRTILHGHRYDDSWAIRELGLRYTPAADTFRRMIDRAVAEGLVKRPLPGRSR